MRHWIASAVAIFLASLPGLATAQVDCEAVQPGPTRTDCYIGMSRLHSGQSDVAAAKARLQSDASRYRQLIGASPSKNKCPIPRDRTSCAERRLKLNDRSDALKDTLRCRLSNAADRTRFLPLGSLG